MHTNFFRVIENTEHFNSLEMMLHYLNEHKRLNIFNIDDFISHIENTIKFKYELKQKNGIHDVEEFYKD